MTTEAIERIFRLYPAIWSWAHGAPEDRVWETAFEAKEAFESYVGPGADPKVLEANHIRHPADIAFITSREAEEAAHSLIDELYASSAAPEVETPVKRVMTIPKPLER